MNSLLLLVNLLGLAIMVTLFHRDVRMAGGSKREGERGRWRSTRESDYVRCAERGRWSEGGGRTSRFDVA